MSLAKKLKLHRITTVLKYLGESWTNSKFIQQQSGKNRISAYFSLLYWFYFYGFTITNFNSMKFWNLTTAEKKSYISFRRNDRLRFRLTTKESYKLFLDKGVFNKIFCDFISRKWINVDKNDKQIISEFIIKHHSAILKPRTDYGGHGVVKITESNLDSIELFDNAILEECIENAASLKIIAPASLNTVRIVSLIDNSGTVRILSAILRMGNGISHTDNYTDDGLACRIDIETGCLKGNAFGRECKEFDKHPYTNIKFDGYVIKEFHQCVDLVKRLALIEPNARYVGWDLAITSEGIEVLEGNVPPGEDITQIGAGRGLWFDILEYTSQNATLPPRK